MLRQLTGLMALVAVFTATPSMATHLWEGGERQVSNVYVTGNAILVLFDPPPAFCQGGNFLGHGHVKIPTDALGADYLYTMILTLFTTDRPLRGIWVEDPNGQPCSTAFIPELYSITVGK